MSAQLSRATREAAIAAAKAKGCIVLEPAEDEIFIDIDDEASATHAIAGINRIKGRCPTLAYTMTNSPSGLPSRFHVVVRITGRVFTQWERIAWQAALGSDRMRELNSVCDILDTDPLPTIFFEKGCANCWDRTLWGSIGCQQCQPGHGGLLRGPEEPVF